jgi:hypothetical protein
VPFYTALQHLLNVLAQIANKERNYKKYKFKNDCYWLLHNVITLFTNMTTCDRETTGGGSSYQLPEIIWCHNLAQHH